MRRLLTWIRQNPLVPVVLLGILVWLIGMPFISSLLISVGLGIELIVFQMSKNKPADYKLYVIPTSFGLLLIAAGVVIWLKPLLLALIDAFTGSA